MALLPLSRGLFAIVDDADFERLSAHRWSAKPVQCSSGGFYAFRSIQRKGIRKTIYLHREVMDAPSEYLIDHVNGDGLDNRKSNLRLSNHSQNNANRDVAKSPNGFRGVIKCNHKYRAYVGKSPNLTKGPLRRCPTVAAFDYDKIAFSRFGDFARLNFLVRDR